ncbi:hypothetical protein [Nocardia sp. NPDC003979]
MAGVAVTDLPGAYTTPSKVRRIGYVEDHQAVEVALSAILSEEPDLAVAALAATVPALLT